MFPAGLLRPVFADIFTKEAQAVAAELHAGNTLSSQRLRWLLEALLSGRAAAQPVLPAQ